ncbi:MAG: RNA methyltransferase [Syntrophomonadaceae bacterium]|nr:RNA methyltransferase [Syntrophomonadaceae bacterium]
MRKSRVYIGLLHYPMYNKRKDIITTSVTNLDLHDISRVARTYDVDGFYVVHPSENQHKLIKEIVSYWQEGYGGEYNPDRREAFARLMVVNNLEEVIKNITDETGSDVCLVATDAHDLPEATSYKQLKERIFQEDKNFLILFGTGWGMQKELVEKCDYILEPVRAVSNYNHLSVRSAVSIILDRLLGEFWFKVK